MADLEQYQQGGVGTSQFRQAPTTTPSSNSATASLVMQGVQTLTQGVQQHKQAKAQAATDKAMGGFATSLANMSQAADSTGKNMDKKMQQNYIEFVNKNPHLTAEANKMYKDATGEVPLAPSADTERYRKLENDALSRGHARVGDTPEQREAAILMTEAEDAVVHNWDVQNKKIDNLTKVGEYTAKQASDEKKKYANATLTNMAESGRDAIKGKGQDIIDQVRNGTLDVVAGTQLFGELRLSLAEQFLDIEEHADAGVLASTKGLLTSQLDLMEQSMNGSIELEALDQQIKILDQRAQLALRATTDGQRIAFASTASDAMVAFIMGDVAYSEVFANMFSLGDEDNKAPIDIYSSRENSEKGFNFVEFMMNNAQTPEEEVRADKLGTKIIEGSVDQVRNLEDATGLAPTVAYVASEAGGKLLAKNPELQAEALDLVKVAYVDDVLPSMEKYMAENITIGGSPVGPVTQFQEEFTLENITQLVQDEDGLYHIELKGGLNLSPAQRRAARNQMEKINAPLIEVSQAMKNLGGLDDLGIVVDESFAMASQATENEATAREERAKQRKIGLLERQLSGEDSMPREALGNVAEYKAGIQAELDELLGVQGEEAEVTPKATPAQPTARPDNLGASPTNIVERGTPTEGKSETTEVTKDSSVEDIKAHQLAVGADADGQLGPQTERAKEFTDIATPLAEEHDVSLSFMQQLAKVESNFQGGAKAGTSSATGYVQMIQGTWDSLVDKYGDEYGVEKGTSRGDKEANIKMGIALTKENAASLTRAKGSEPTAGELYLAHFAGIGAATKAIKEAPSASVDTVLSKGAMNANKSIAFKNGKPVTIGVFLAWAEDKMKDVK